MTAPASPFVGRVLSVIARYEGGMPAACDAMGIRAQDLDALANGFQASPVVLDAICEWIDAREGLSQQEREDYERLRTAARQVTTITPSHTSVGRQPDSLAPKPRRRVPVVYAFAAGTVAIVIIVVATVLLTIALVRPRNANANGDAPPSRAVVNSSSSPSEAAAESSTATSRDTETPVATPSLTPTPISANVHVLYQDVTLDIPPMSWTESTGITLSPIPSVSPATGIESTGDLVYDNLQNPPWSGDELADIGTQVPSYSRCEQLINRDPIDLTTQNLYQGHGYCLQVANDEIGFVRIVSIAPGDGNGGSGEITLVVTLWQSQSAGS